MIKVFRILYFMYMISLFAAVIATALALNDVNVFEALGRIKILMILAAIEIAIRGWYYIQNTHQILKKDVRLEKTYEKEM